VSTVKVLMEEKDCSNGLKYSSMAALISQTEGFADPEKSEKVR